MPLPPGSWVGLNAYEAIPELRTICVPFGITLVEPTEEEIQGVLFQTLGKGKVYGSEYRKVDESLLYSNKVLDAIQLLLQRVPLRSVYGVGRPNQPVVVLGTACTVNWEVRRMLELFLYLLGSCEFVTLAKHNHINCADTAMVELFASLVVEDQLIVEEGLEVKQTFLLGGPRLTEDAAGTPNPYIGAFVDDYRVLPSELQMLSRIHHDIFGYWHDDAVTGSDDLSKLVVKFAEYHRDLAGSNFYVSLNAGAVDKVEQIRNRLREVWGDDFDSNPNDPQFYFSADGFRVACNPEDAKNPAAWQSPLTFASAVPRYAKMFWRLSQEG